MSNTKIENLLQQKQVKSTAMRNLVLQYFLKINKAIDLKELENVFFYADRTTLFRTIKTFKDKGVIHEIKDGTNTTKYALCNEHCTSENHFDIHPHFYCEKCKQTTCLRKISIPSISIGNDFMIHSTNLVIKGICKLCNSVA